MQTKPNFSYIILNNKGYDINHIKDTIITSLFCITDVMFNIHLASVKEFFLMYRLYIQNMYTQNIHTCTCIHARTHEYNI